MAIDADNLNFGRRKISSCIRNKKLEVLKCEINELETGSKNKNIRELYRGINGFKKGFQPITILVKM
jgi:hypothetical protein